MTKKFFKQKVRQIDGPKQKLNFLSDEEEITKEEAEKIINDYFEPYDFSNAKEMRDRAWNHILDGTSVTVDDICISHKEEDV